MKRKKPGSAKWRAGWHLQTLGLPGFYTFIAGEPRNDVYRLDFVISQKDNQLQDEGWEFVGRMGGWQYFRAEVKAGHVPEIANEWKIAKYYRVLGFLVIFLPIWMIFLTRHTEQSELAIYEIARFIGFIFFVLYVIAILMIFRRMLQLKRR